LHVRSTVTGEIRTQDVVVVNGGPPAGLQQDATLAFSTAAHTNFSAAPPVGKVHVLFNGETIGELTPGAAEAYSFTIRAGQIRAANTLSFQFEQPGDGMRIGSPVLTIKSTPMLDVRDHALQAVKRAHWGDDAAGWGGFNVGDGKLLETPFIRNQNTFCFVPPASK